MAAASFPPSHSQPLLLVGREREQAQLADCFVATLGGHGRLTLISGEAGIGKTALANALGHDAAAQGAFVLGGRCYDHAETPPYGLWSDLFARYQHTDSDRPDALPPLPPPFATRGAVGAVASQAVLFYQVLDWVRAVATRQPLVLILDDVHWSDAASLDLLRFLARSCTTLPMMLIAAYRAEDIAPDHPCAALVPLLARETDAARIELRRLDAEALSTYVERRYALSGNDAASLAGYLRERSEGNPFFMTELLHALEDEGVLRWHDGRWMLGALPRTGVPLLLRQVIEAQLARLGPAAQPLLSVAAVIGQEAPLALWQTVSGAEESALFDLVERAVAAHVLEETRDGVSVRFVHALIRETLYEGMLAARRRAWHRAIGEALAAAHDPDPDLVAHHFGAAGDEQAGAWFARAGLRAQRAGAWQTAGERYAMALTLVPDTEATASERGWLNLARARMEAYNPLSAAPYLVKAAQMAERVGDRVLAGVVACYRSLSRYSLGDMRGGIAEMEATVAALQSLSTEERATLRDRREWIGWALDEDDGAGQLATFLAYAGRLGEARAIAGRIVAAVPTSTGRHDGSGRARADALFALAAVAAMDGMPDEARHRMRESWHAYDDLGAYDEATRSLYIEALWINGMYPLEDADARTRLQDDLLRAWAKTSVSLMPQFSDDLMRLPLAGIAGEWVLLRQYADHFPLGGIILEIIPRVVLASIAYAQGDAARVWALVDEVLPDGAATEPGGTNFFTALVLHRFAARLAMDATDLPAARAWIAAHERWLAWSGAALGQAESNLLWAHYHRASGDAAQAEERARQALAQATAPRQPLALLATHRFLAERATAAGRYAEADEHLGNAALLAEVCGAPYECALTLLARAERRAATGDASAAMTLLDQGRAILTPLGARPALARADALTARLAATVVAPPPHYPDNLTAREVDVLRLLAGGRSNRAIGEALGINARTAERHITNVYRKIDVYGRAEAAAYAVRHNLI